MAWKFDELLADEQQQKVRKRPTHEEDNLQRNCVRWFDIQYPKLSLMLHHSPNEGKRSGKEGNRNSAMGTRKGFPDLIFLRSHMLYSYLAIELKTKTGRLTDEQKDYRTAVNTSGGCYVIIRSLEDFITCVTQYITNQDMDEWISRT